MADDIDVRVGGDLSDLESSLDGAASHAEQAASKIADAFNFSAGEQLNESLTEISNSALRAGEQLSLFGGAAEDAASQMTLFDTNSIEAADSMRQVGDAATDLPPKLEEIATSAHHAGEAAHEAEGGFAEFGAELLKLGGVVLGLEGLKELASEALGAFANVQKAEIALTALTGSAKQAGESIEKLKELALSDALSFSSLLQAQQRMTAFGFESEKIPGILQTIADASAATGRDFDAVSNSVERMALAGNVAGRQLATLGLSVADLAKVLNVADGQVKETFKSLDVSERVEVITQALRKYQGVAQEVAQSISGQWQILKTKTEFEFEEIGKAIAPAVGILSELATAVQPAVHELVSGFGDSASAVFSFAGAVKDAGPAIAGLIDAATGLGGFLGTVRDASKSVGNSFTFELVPGSQAATEGLKALTLAMSAYSGKGPEIDTMNKLIANGLRDIASAAKMGGDAFKDAWNLSVIQAGLGSVSTEIKSITDAQSKANIELKAAKEAFDAIHKSYTDGTPLANGYAASAQDVARAQKALDEATSKANISIKAQVDSFAALSDAQKTADDTLKRALDSLNTIARLYADGKASADLFQRAQLALNKAWDDANLSLKDFGKEQLAYADAVVAADAAAKKILDTFNKLHGIIPGVKDDVSKAKDEWFQCADAATTAGIAITNFTDSESNAVGATVDLTDAIENAKKSMVDQAAAAYEAATAVNSLAQAERDAASAAPSGGGGGRGKGGAGSMSGGQFINDIVGAGGFSSYATGFLESQMDAFFEAMGFVKVANRSYDTLDHLKQVTNDPNYGSFSFNTEIKKAADSISEASKVVTNAFTDVANSTKTSLSAQDLSTAQLYAQVTQQIEDAKAAGQLHDALDALQAALWKQMPPTLSMALQSTNLASSLGDAINSTNIFTDATTVAGTTLATASQQISQATTAVSGAAAVALQLASVAAQALDVPFNGAMAVQIPAGIGIPNIPSTPMAGAANARNFGPPTQSIQINVSVDAGSVVGDQGINRLADIIQQRTIQTLRQAGLK